MTDRDSYLEDKQTQIIRWIGRLARLDALCRGAGDDVRIKFEVQLKEFSQNLNELNKMFIELQESNEPERERFRQLVEKSWRDLEESFHCSVAEYEYLISGKPEE